MPRKHALTLAPSKRSSSSLPADSLLEEISLSVLLMSNIQIETFLHSSFDKKDDKSSSETINYLIEYHFKYKNDILLQSLKIVNL